MEKEAPVTRKDIVASNQVNTSKQKRRKLNSKTIPWLMTIPAIMVVLLLTIFPLLYSLKASFYNQSALVPGTPFIGLENFRNLLINDPQFIWALFITAVLTFISVAIEFLFGLAIALAVIGKLKGKKFFIPLFILPVTLAPVVVGYTWKLMFDAKYGPINHFISILTGTDFNFNWLNHSIGSIFAIIVSDVWQWTPFMFLVLLAGLSAIPKDIYEAAAVDGAGRWNMFYHITLPMLVPTITIAILIRALDSLKMFDTIWAITQGGPGTITQNISMYIYRLGFDNFRIGYTAAATYLLLIVVVIGCTLFISRMSKMSER